MDTELYRTGRTASAVYPSANSACKQSFSCYGNSGGISITRKNTGGDESPVFLQHFIFSNEPVKVIRTPADWLLLWHCLFLCVSL